MLPHSISCRRRRGGWPAKKKYYKASDSVKLGNDYVDWGPTGKTKLNETNG